MALFEKRVHRDALSRTITWVVIVDDGRSTVSRRATRFARSAMEEHRPFQSDDRKFCKLESFGINKSDIDAGGVPRREAATSAR